MNIIVFSGGTATNSLTLCFKRMCLEKKNGEAGTEGNLSYILPISDNGGSTSEILRVFGGPAIGDIRSRITRVINDEHLKFFYSYRLSEVESEAKAEWIEIIGGNHKIWADISIELKDLLRSFLISIQSEILKRSKTSMNSFNFAKASVGNLFLSSVRIFIGGSLDSSVELMMRIGRADKNVNVIPCINTNHTHHISALLANGDIITGQSQISHPSPVSTDSDNEANNFSKQFVHLNEKFAKTTLETNYEQEDFAIPAYILPELRSSQLYFTKLYEDAMLPVKVEKIFYINPYGEEIRPHGNGRVINKIIESDMIVYSIGSLMTSLIPTIILGNVAQTIYLSHSNTIKKILLINNKYDRETLGLTGYNYVKFIVDSMKNSLLEYSAKKLSKTELQTLSEKIMWNSFITDIVCLEHSEIKIDPADFRKHGLNIHTIDSNVMENDSLATVLTEIHNNR